MNKKTSRYDDVEYVEAEVVTDSYEQLKKKQKQQLTQRQQKLVRRRKLQQMVSSLQLVMHRLVLSLTGELRTQNLLNQHLQRKMDIS